MTRRRARASIVKWLAIVICTPLARPARAQPAPTPTPIPISVTFDRGDAEVFTDAEATVVGDALARAAEAQCVKHFLKVYQFQAVLKPLASRPHLRVFLKQDGGWSVCASITPKPVDEAAPAEWAIRFREAGESLPPKTELVDKLEHEWIPALFRTHAEAIKPRLRERAPVGQGGAINPQPLVQVDNALASLALEAGRYVRMRNLAFRIEGVCATTGARMVVFSDFCDLGRQPALDQFRLVKRDAKPAPVTLGPADLPCLANFQVGRIYLLDEPDPSDD